VVVVGLGPLGASVVVQAAQRWHAHIAPGERASDDRASDDGTPATTVLTVTAVGDEAGAWLRGVSLEHPRFAGWAQVDTLDLDPSRPDGDAVDRFRSLLAGGSVTDVFVALDDETTSLTTALLVRHGLGGNRAVVHVQTRSVRGLATLVGDADGSIPHPVPIRPFPVIDHTCTAAAISGGTNEQVAMAVHDDYLVRARAEGRSGASVRPWDDLGDPDREANRGAAAGLVAELRSVGYLPIPALGWDHETFRFGDDEVEVLAAAEHERWKASRLAEGWRHGPERDDARRINPELVPWTETSEDGRRFNRDYIRQVPAMLARAGFELIPFDTR
jgi:hypothetical protein